MPEPLTLRRLLHLYLPLALTFLLMSGSSPFINKGIGRLADETTGLAVFANAFVICLFLYSPCFAVRDAAQKFIRGRASYRRTLVFHLAVAGACTLPLLVVSRTSVLDEFALKSVMRLPDGLLDPVKRAMLAFLPIPALIVLRGVHQAVHITNDTPKWIGIGTAGRFVMILAFVFLVGVPLGLEGGVIGGLSITLGIATETVVNLVTARRRARILGLTAADPAPPTYGRLWAFCGPLFLANIMGVFLQPLAIAIVNAATLSETSAAAFGIVKSFTWFFSSTLFAMQTMTLARADSVPNLRRLLVFEVIPVGFFTALIVVTAFVPPVRDGVLGGFFEIDERRTAAFVAATLPIALVLPLLMAIRSTARGLLMRSGMTFWVTLGSLGGLLLLLSLRALDLSAAHESGTTIGYVCWLSAMALDMLILLYGVVRVGIGCCVSEGLRAPRVSSRPAERP